MTTKRRRRQRGRGGWRRTALGSQWKEVHRVHRHAVALLAGHVYRALGAPLTPAGGHTLAGGFKFSRDFFADVKPIGNNLVNGHASGLNLADFFD